MQSYDELSTNEQKGVGGVHGGHVGGKIGGEWGVSEAVPGCTLCL